MTDVERIAWVKTLKSGDQVCYKIPGSLGGKVNIRVVLVKNITKTGAVRVSDSMLFNNQGKSNGGSRFIFLEPYTAEVADAIERSKLIDSASHSAFILDSNRVPLSKVPNELLRELINLEARISLSLKEPVEKVDS